MNLLFPKPAGLTAAVHYTLRASGSREATEPAVISSTFCPGSLCKGNMNKYTPYLAAATLFAGMHAAPTAAQVTLTPRALGMGGAYVAAARGNESVFLNPANLGLSGTPQWSIAFPQVAFGATVLGPDFADLPEIANYDDMDGSRRSEIFNAIPATGTELRYDLRAPLVAFQNGRFAVGVAYGSVGHHTVSKDIVDLIFNGYEDGRTDYSVGDTHGSRATFWDVAAAYGRRIGRVSFGVTGHYIHGGTVLNSRLFEPSIDIEGRDMAIDYRAVYTRGGQGYGVDFGVAVQPISSITLSASLINAVARMRWSSDLYTRTLTLDSNDFQAANYMILENRYETSEQRIEASATSLEVLQTAHGLYDQAYFPAVLNVGAAWEGSHGTVVSAAYRDQLTEGRLGQDWSSMAGIGLQQKLPLVTLRAGYASDLDGGSMVTGGVSLGVLQFGIGKLDQGGSALPRSGWVGTFGVGVRTKGELQ